MSCCRLLRPDLQRPERPADDGRMDLVIDLAVPEVTGETHKIDTEAAYATARAELCRLREQALCIELEAHIGILSFGWLSSRITELTTSMSQAK